MIRQLLSAILFVLTLIHAPQAVTDRPAVPLGGATLGQPGSGEFVFGVIGDFRPTRRDRPFPAVFNQMMEEIKIIGPAIVISTGDMYYGYGGTPQRFKNEVDYVMNMAKGLSFPFISVVGNHEVVGDATREEYVAKYFKNLYGSFDVGTSHFILLNTDEVGREGTISGEQLRWLKQDLEANRNAEHIFVFMHRPMFSIVDPLLVGGTSFKDAGNRDSLHDLFKRYRVKTAFGGHEHLFDSRLVDGVRYTIVGGGGAPLYEPASEGGFFHYLLVKVKGDKVTTDVLMPFSIDVRKIAGGDGFEPKAELEVTNRSNSSLPVKNLTFHMPRAERHRYWVKAVSISSQGVVEARPAEITRVRDRGDGSADIGVAVSLRKREMLRVSVEVDY